MTDTKKVSYLMISILAIILLPYIGARMYFGGEFPANYFVYPPLTVPEKADFNVLFFIAIAAAFLVVICVYIFPSWFGFKKVMPTPKKEGDVPDVNFPLWFWIGLILWGGTLVVLWGKFSEPKWLLNWADLPVFWGFTFMLDGIVYKRTGGKSIFSKYPQELIGIGTASVSGWLIFEYLNFYVEDNWLYPKGNLIPVNEFVLYAVLGSSGLMPMAFEWYSLFQTFDKFKHRFSNGKKLVLPKWLKTAALVICLAGLFGAAFFHNFLFFSLWVSPLIILSIVLERLNIWTPFRSIKNGNWSPVLIFALTYFIQGFLLESWNYFGGTHGPDATLLHTFNPAYWTYSIPYVDILHVFEMPLLGLMGYLPFGIYCWIWWIVFGFLLKLPSRFYGEHMED